MVKVRIGVVGLGHIGKIHSRLLKQNGDVDFVGVYDIDARRTVEVANQLSVHPFRTLSELIDAVDAVFIVTPTSTHYDIAVQALSAGKHCFIEKPVTATYREAWEIHKKAEEIGCIVQVGHIERFNPALLVLRQYDVRPFFIEAHRLAPFKLRALDVSVVLDLMIHDIDIMLWLMKERITKIHAHGVAVLTPRVDIANARIEFSSGAIANLTASRLSKQQMRKFRIFQQQCYFSLDFSEQQVEIYRVVPKDTIEPLNIATILGSVDTGSQTHTIIAEKPSVPPINPMEEEHRTFIHAIRTGQPPAVSVVEAAEALRIAEEIESIVQENMRKLQSITKKKS